MGFPRKEPSSSITTKTSLATYHFFILACKGFLCPNCLQCNYSGKTHRKPLISNTGKWYWRPTLLGRVIHTPGEDIKKMHDEENCTKALQNRRKIEKYFSLPLILAWIYTRERCITHRADNMEETSNKKDTTSRHENTARESKESRIESFSSVNKGH